MTEPMLFLTDRGGRGVQRSPQQFADGRQRVDNSCSKYLYLRNLDGIDITEGGNVCVV
jgi:hypothetical protein